MVAERRDDIWRENGECLAAANYCVTSSRNSRHRIWRDARCVVDCIDGALWSSHTADSLQPLSPSPSLSISLYLPTSVCVCVCLHMSLSVYDDNCSSTRWQLVRVLSALRHDLSLVFLSANELIRGYVNTRQLKLTNRASTSIRYNLNIFVLLTLRNS